MRLGACDYMTKPHRGGGLLCLGGAGPGAEGAGPGVEEAPRSRSGGGGERNVVIEAGGDDDETRWTGP
jgi:hypothetical protein